MTLKKIVKLMIFVKIVLMTLMVTAVAVIIPGDVSMISSISVGVEYKSLIWTKELLIEESVLIGRG